MKFAYLVIAGLILLLLLGCQQDPKSKEYPKSFRITLDNRSGPNRVDEAVILDIKSIVSKYPDFNPMSMVVLDDTTELASQVDDFDADHEADQIVFVCNLEAGKSKIITIRYADDGPGLREYKKRTQAELSHKIGGKFVNRVYEGGEFQNVEYLEVPPEHTVHSWFIRYEGPGWESDKIGYRFYLDWRNATDIFGKKTHDMVLQDVGQDGFDSYHEMSDWGMDILKVGDSFGIGSWGMWEDGKAYRVSETDDVECTIISNGCVESVIRTDYAGWKVGKGIYNLSSTLTINAGSRLTKCNLEITNQPKNLCTGIVKDQSANVIKSGADQENWQYLATYGKQSLANDNLGMAILYKKSDLIEITEDELNQLVVLRPSDGKVTYYFLAAWEKEPNGIVNETQFKNYLDETIERLNHPVVAMFQ